MTILDDAKEVEMVRQKELNSLSEMGAMTPVKRSEAADKRVIQTRWANREKDGRVKSRLVLKDFNRKPRAYSARDVCTDTIDTASENNVGCKFT